MTSLEDLLPEPSASDLLKRLRSILAYAAEGGALGREHAVIYLDLRQRLLDSDIGKLLPGFLYQCVTVFRFKEFIALYDPDTELRIAFIDRMIARCIALHPPENAPKPSDDDQEPWAF